MDQEWLAAGAPDGEGTQISPDNGQVYQIIFVRNPDEKKDSFHTQRNVSDSRHVHTHVSFIILPTAINIILISVMFLQQKMLWMCAKLIPAKHHQASAVSIQTTRSPLS